MAAKVGMGQGIVNSCRNDPVFSTVQTLGSITCLVMAILGIHGVISHVALGATMIGIGGASIAATLFSNASSGGVIGKCCTIIKELVVCILFGALATAGVMSAFTTGWVYTGIWIAGATCASSVIGVAWCAGVAAENLAGFAAGALRHDDLDD